MAEEKAQDGNTAEQKQFQIQKIYIKDVSFETPNSPQIFQQDWKPEMNFQLGNTAKKLGDEVYEVVVSVTVTAKQGENTAYLVEVQQAGIFTLSHFTDEEIGPMVGSYCPSLLFPYVREVISDLVTKAGFPPMLLAPVNFDMVYAQHQQKLKAQAQAQSAGEVH